MALFSQAQKDLPSEKSKQSIFVKKEKPEDTEIKRRTEQILTSINAHLTLLEDRYNQVRNKINFTEHELLESRKKINSRIKVLDDELNDINKSIDEIREKVLGLHEEVSGSAKKENINVIEKYLDMWEPLDFVTRSEVKQALNKLQRK